MTPAAKLRRSVRQKVADLGGQTRCYVSPGHCGVADLLVFLPGGEVRLLEIKAGKDTIRPAQRREAELMGRMGHITRFIRTEKDIDEALK